MTDWEPNPDDDFFDKFLAPMEEAVLRTVWRIVRSRDLLQDTVQDALATMWRCREKIRLHPNPTALMLKIAADASLDALRRSLRQQRRECVPLEMEPAAPMQVTPAMQVESDQLEGIVRSAIAGLPRQQALAVLLRLVHEQPYSEVARALECSEPTARIHVMRGRARLRRILSQSGAGLQGSERGRR
jgi:RNA polymerase sigma-70 factor (ECF subfamily)